MCEMLFTISHKNELSYLTIYFNNNNRINNNNNTQNECKGVISQFTFQMKMMMKINKQDLYVQFYLCYVHT